MFKIPKYKEEPSPTKLLELCHSWYAQTTTDQHTEKEHNCDFCGRDIMEVEKALKELSGPSSESVVLVFPPYPKNLDEMSPQQMGMVMRELEEASKCPVCLNTLQPPLLVCKNKHSMCSPCSKGSTCPTCSSTMTDIESGTTIVDILNLLPRKCKHWKNGCKAYFTKVLLVQEGAKCSYRKVACRLMHCNWEGEAFALIAHIKADHHPIYTSYSSMAWNIESISQDRYTISPIEGPNCIFWMYSKIDTKKQKCYIFFVCVPTAHEMNDEFFWEVIFTKVDSTIIYKHTQKVFMENVDAEQIISNENCMQVPLQELSHFTAEGGNATMYHFKVF